MLVIAGNQYIADYASRLGAPRVEFLPTSVALRCYNIDSKASSSHDFLPSFRGMGRAALNVVIPAYFGAPPWTSKKKLTDEFKVDCC